MINKIYYYYLDLIKYDKIIVEINLSNTYLYIHLYPIVAFRKLRKKS